MKKDPKLDALRTEVLTQVMALPVAYNEYIYDDMGVSYNAAVMTLVDQLTEKQLAGQAEAAGPKPYHAADVERIVAHIKRFLDSAPGPIHSYEERVQAYVLALG